MMNYLETQTISAFQKTPAESAPISVKSCEINTFDIKNPIKLGEYPNTQAFDAGSDKVVHAAVEIPDAMAFMPNGFIITNNTSLVEESLWQAAIHKRADVVVSKATGWKHLIQEPDRKNVLTVDKRELLFAYHRFYNQYFHWFIDCLPRVWQAQKHDVKFSEYYCGDFEDGAFQDTTLKLLGIKGKRITFDRKYNVLKFKELLYSFSTLKENLKVRPSFKDGVHHKGGWDPVYLDSINQKITDSVSPAHTSQYKRIYVQRPKTGHRRLQNADQFEKFLDENGFFFVDPGRYHFEDQVRIFREAEFVVGAHGAGLTNILWADRTKIRGVFEITINGINDTGYTFISSGLDLPHYIFPADPTAHKFGPAFADLSFDSGAAISALRKII